MGDLRYTEKSLSQAQMRLEKPLIFNFVALLVITTVSWRNPGLLFALQDMAVGTSIALAVSGFARQQAQSAIPRDYD